MNDFSNKLAIREASGMDTRRLTHLHLARKMLGYRGDRVHFGQVENFDEGIVRLNWLANRNIHGGHETRYRRGKSIAGGGSPDWRLSRTTASAPFSILVSISAATANARPGTRLLTTAR